MLTLIALKHGCRAGGPDALRAGRPEGRGAKAGPEDSADHRKAATLPPNSAAICRMARRPLGAGFGVALLDKDAARHATLIGGGDAASDTPLRRKRMGRPVRSD